MGEIWEYFRDPTIPDLHSKNQRDFVLPDRNIAKRFTFKMLYGGTAWGFSVDNNFSHVSDKVEFWEDVISKFYHKYKQIKLTHDKWVEEVINNGKLIMPTGREYHFDRREVVRQLWKWRPKILNYPVQGLGADLVAIVRVSLRNRLLERPERLLMVSTVHDSIDLDVDIPEKACYNICKLVKDCIERTPANFEKLFQTPFNLPLTGEVAYGPNLGTLTPYKESHIAG